MKTTGFKRYMEEAEEGKEVKKPGQTHGEKERRDLWRGNDKQRVT